MRKIDRRFAAWGAALLLLAVLPVFAGFAGIGRELCQLAGLLGCIACVALCGAPVRPRDALPPTLLTLKLHSSMGWLALAAVVIHVIGLLFDDHVVWEYLKPSAPAYQLAGIAAGAILLAVVLSGTAAVRRRLWSSHRSFQATHVILGCLLTALIAVHVIVTDRYSGGRGRRAVVIAATIGSLAMLMRRRRPSAGTTVASGPLRLSVFGRHSRLILSVASVLAVGLCGLIGGATSAALREPLLARTERVPLDFPHARHVSVNCLTCHHNFADGRGMDTCVGCHRSSRSDLKMGAQARFHTFCLDCHRHPVEAVSDKHGPVAGCALCHRTPGST